MAAAIHFFQVPGIAIAKARLESKALLCFVADNNNADSTQWESVLRDPEIADQLRSSTVMLKVFTGSKESRLLNDIYPVQSVPAVLIVQKAEVVANYQHGQIPFEDFKRELFTRYTPKTEPVASPSTSLRQRLPGYLDLPPSEGRMRLPNNAYDHLRKLTQQYLDSGVSGKGLLNIQLKLLGSVNSEPVTTAIQQIRDTINTDTEPSLSDQAIERLLNTPASSIRQAPPSSNNDPAGSGSSHEPQRTQQAGATTNAGPQSSTPLTTPRPLQQTDSHASSSTTSTSNRTSTTAQNTAAQRAEYISSQKAAEAERARIKAQIEADKRTRREADRKARDEAEALRRRTELHELRKANSTTSNPQATDVRIQVRLFDGGTIRSSFASENTIALHVRPWIEEQTKKNGSGVAGRPYDLKLILTPLPNRSIEAGEEDTPLSDIEGIQGSATLVMVPVKTYVDSYGNTAGNGGLVGSAIGAAQSVVGTGIGIVGSAAGILVGGLGRLMGAGVTPQPTSNTQAQDTDASSRPSQGETAARDVRNVRVRTLADQRRDEEEEAKKRGTNLYNGMGLNVQPRGDDNEHK
ncbi:hypothetical protein LTR05_004545 [Lithohypha guttulata]|uniref:UBX domain-containing protein 2 n=1 Tax=Lithohypha guttulata TaxID=1690604 RepID=A0AAN7SZE6_9EURO|nr:hypothetical protein LTR05_004545 [Lithohypha guttulata]